MKTVLKRIIILAVVFAMLTSCFVACDEITGGNEDTKTENTSTPVDDTDEKVTYTLDLSVDKEVALRGDKVTLTAVLKAEGEEDIPSEDTEFIIVNGSDYATVSGNTLTILNTAPDGATIAVQAKEGASYSNTVMIKVSVPLNSIAISADTARPVAGQSIVINKVVDPTDATQPITWSITEGADIASMAGDVLMISESAEVDAVIKLKAISGEVESNELVFTVKSSTDEIKVNKITISADNLNLLAGQSVVITSVLDPVNTTDDITLAIIAGAEYATLVGNVLIVKNNAPAGAVIEVEATSGSIRSNELVFTVRDTSKPATEITINAVNLTPLAGHSVTINYMVTPEDTTDKVSWVITEGADIASMAGNVLVISDIAAANAVIKVKAVVGSVESDELVFTVKEPVDEVIKAEKIIISAEQDNVLPGQSLAIETKLEPANTTDIFTLVITEGKEYATLLGNVLVVSNTAPAGALIKVKANTDIRSSNELTFTVADTSKPAEEVVISVNDSDTNPFAGNSVIINYTITPSDTTDKLTWVITEGSDFATMAGNVLVVSKTAPDNAVIKVKAVVGNVDSNELSFTVRPSVEIIPVESITISTDDDSGNVLAGTSVVINKVINPDNATDEVSWVITEGVSYATVSGDVLVISKNAKAGTVIKIKAVAGDKESNELTFTVQASQEEINASRFYIDLSAESFRIDKKGTAAIPTLIAKVYNYNYDEVSGKQLEFSVIEGAQYLGITSTGDSCTFQILGHGTAVVQVKIAGTDIVETATVDVIVPPDSIVLPEVFLERNNIEYSFSMIDHTITGTNGNVVNVAGEAKLPFAPSVSGTGLVCQDMVFNFAHESGATGDEVAVYDQETKSIIFKQTGKVTVTVSSASGSKIEATTSYTFNINDGYNVNTFEELWLVVRNSQYQGQQINFVVLEKPDGSANNYEYGYDLVPLVALKPQKDQTVDEILRGPDEVPAMTSNRIQAVNKSLYINGNNHKIDVSQMRIFTMAEYDAYCEEYGVTEKIYNVSSLLSAEPWNAGGDVDAGTNNNKTYSVNLYNVETKGNQPIDYDPTLYRYENSTEMNIGCYTHGISIGSRGYDCHYYIDANNLTSSAFYAGMNFIGIVGNGKVSNAYAYNCFSTGIFSRSNIITFENLKFGACGAAGLELAPEECNEAGLNDNEVQQVTFLGKIEASFLNDGTTQYFQNYKLDGTTTVPMIINGNVAGIVEAGKQYGSEAAGKKVVEHIQNSNGQFIFVSLIFNNLSTLEANNSIVHYPDYQKGGIITVEQLLTNVLTTGEIDTTHQFIEMPIQVPGMGTVGKALFYNQYYQQ